MSISSNYQNMLKRQIEDYSANLMNIQMNPQNADNIKINKNIFGSSGISRNAVNYAKSNDIFSAAKRYGGNNTTASQSNTNQKNVSNSTSQAITFVSQVKTNAVNKLKNVINQLQAKLDNTSSTDKSTSAEKLSGQSVRPKDNMPLDNQGKENKAAKHQDSQRPNVGFGEETVQDKEKTDNNKSKKETKVNKKEQEKHTNTAKTSADLDKAAKKETDKIAQESFLKLQQENNKMNNKNIA